MSGCIKTIKTINILINYFDRKIYWKNYLIFDSEKYSKMKN